MGNHGGKRQGAGRRAGSGKYGEPTVAMRIPKSLADEVKGFVRVKRVKRQKIDRSGRAWPEISFAQTLRKRKKRRRDSLLCRR